MQPSDVAGGYQDPQEKTNIGGARILKHQIYVMLRIFIMIVPEGQITESLILDPPQKMCYLLQ